MLRNPIFGSRPKRCDVTPHEDVSFLMYICIATYINMYIYMYIYLCIYIYTYICTNFNIISIYVYTYIHTYTDTRVRICMDIYMYTYTFKYIHTQICMYIVYRNLYIPESPWLNGSLSGVKCRTHIANHTKTHAHTHTHTLQSWIGWENGVHVTLWLSNWFGGSPSLLNKGTQSLVLPSRCKYIPVVWVQLEFTSLLQWLDRAWNSGLWLSTCHFRDYKKCWNSNL